MSVDADPLSESDLASLFATDVVEPGQDTREVSLGEVNRNVLRLENSLGNYVRSDLYQAKHEEHSRDIAELREENTRRSVANRNLFIAVLGALAGNVGAYVLVLVGKH